jgi:hypothetical protein
LEFKSFDTVPLTWKEWTKMVAKKWLFKDHLIFIAKVSDKATPFAIHTAKNNDNIFMRAFRALIEDEDIGWS